MQAVIAQKLKEIEEAEGVRILYAAESGSRAWGFASLDSDYDVRFLYVRRLEDYLCVVPSRDVIEWQQDAVLDINGWDLQKAFRLLRKSNPTLFEWANSPVIYQKDGMWDALLPVINDCFSSKAGVYHYLHMAEENYREYLKDDRVRAKKYLYVIRPILACKWILRNAAPPPMLFERLMEAELEDALWPVVSALLEAKRKCLEMESVPRIDGLNQYIEENLSTLAERVRKIPSNPPVDLQRLNRLFQRAVIEYDA